ncbi:MAG: alpha/beta hydrolase-fold protein [Chloroflexi bacterium]|nr:alpha/beta hydrolase-fold protein [Chloroflexota bacterium]
MEGTANKGSALDYVSITPTDYEESRAYPVIILVHGFGASMYDLAGLAPGIHQTGYVYLCPNGTVPLDIGGGQIGFGWTTPDGFNDPEEAKNTEEAFDAFMEEVREPYGLEPGNMLIIGFSQGGGLAYRYGLPRPDVFAGIGALSASIHDMEQLATQLPDERTQPIFVGHGDQDQVVPIDRGRSANTQLEQWGYGDLIYNEYGGAGHEITPTELRDLSQWAVRVLPPADPQTPGVSPGGIILP